MTPSLIVIPLLIAAAMPFILTGIAKWGAFNLEDNKRTREWQIELTGWRKRAYWAHLNSFEAFPIFAGAVLSALILVPGSEAAQLLAWCFIALRITFVTLFVKGKSNLRSIVWVLALGCNAAIYVIAIID